MYRKNGGPAPAAEEVVDPALQAAQAVVDGEGAAPAEPSTEAGTEPSTEAGTEPSTEAGTEPSTEAGTDPGTEAGTDPGTEAEKEGEVAAAQADAAPDDWEVVKNELPSHVWLKARSRHITHAFFPEVRFNVHSPVKVERKYIDNWLYEQIKAGVLEIQEP